MKKPKISLDSAKLQRLLVQHVEKVLLVVVVCVTLFLVYQGLSLPGLDAARSPQGLLAVSQETKTHIDKSDRWTELQLEPVRQVDPNVVEKVQTTLKDNSPDPYYLPMAWSKPNFPKLSPRTDPEIFTPLHLTVHAIVGPLALVPDPSDVDPLAQVPVEEEEGAKPKRPRPKAKAPPPMPGAGILGGDPAGGRKGPRRRRGGDEAALADPMGEMALVPDGMDAGGMDAGGMAMGMDSGTAQATVHPESIRGFEAQSATAQATRAVVVMAVVPYEKQVEEFQNALASSLDHDRLRDTPLYLQYMVQRADVTDDPDADAATLDWTTLSYRSAKDEQLNWAGVLTEVVDPNYVDPTLTLPAPPFMQRDLWPMLTHPDVPLLPLAVESTTTTTPGRFKLDRGAKPESDLPTIEGIRLPPGSARGSDAGGIPAMPGMAAGGAHGMQPGSPAMAPAGIGGDGMGGDGMGGYGSGSGSAALPPSKYKLIRFTDTTVEAGHQYRYRMNVALQDPNHPATELGYLPPPPASLDPKVRERIKGLGANVFWVTAEKWSDPSPVATIPSTRQYFAGPVTQPNLTPLIQGKPPIPNSQPVGKALAVVWDDAKVVDVPAEVDVYRGSILNFVKDAKVIHPVTHQVVDLSKYAFATDAIVADLMGGDVIPLLDKRSGKSPLTAPGELLIFDSDGKLQVRNETDDIEGYRRFLVPDAPAKPDPAAGQGGEFNDILGGVPAMALPTVPDR